MKRGLEPLCSLSKPSIKASESGRERETRGTGLIKNKVGKTKTRFPLFSFLEEVQVSWRF